MIGDPQNDPAGDGVEDEQVQEQQEEHAQGDPAHEQTQTSKYSQVRRMESCILEIWRLPVVKSIESESRMQENTDTNRSRWDLRGDFWPAGSGTFSRDPVLFFTGSKSDL